jgi:hypothetical protein
MIDLSYGGLFGAILGTIVAAVVYGPVVDLVERTLRARSAQEPQAPALSQHERTMLWRGLFAFDLLIFAGLGYWLGDTIVG